MDPVSGALLLAGIGGGLGMLSGSLNYRHSKKLLAMQQNWAERMASTAHQREVDDLRKAGLNPILSSHSSGSQVSGVSAPSFNGFDVSGSVTDALKAGVDMAKLDAGVQNTTADTNLKDAQIETEQTLQTLNKANAAKADADARLVNAQAGITERQSPYKNQYIHDLDTVLKETDRNVVKPAWNWYSDNIGKPFAAASNRFFDAVIKRTNSKSGYSKGSVRKNSARPVKIERWNPAYGDRGYGGFY